MSALIAFAASAIGMLLYGAHKATRDRLRIECSLTRSNTGSADIDPDTVGNQVQKMIADGHRRVTMYFSFPSREAYQKFYDKLKDSAPEYVQIAWVDDD